jgi:hypothetical protein
MIFIHVPHFINIWRINHRRSFWKISWHEL